MCSWRSGFHTRWSTRKHGKTFPAQTSSICSWRTALKRDCALKPPGGGDHWEQSGWIRDGGERASTHSFPHAPQVTVICSQEHKPLRQKPDGFLKSKKELYYEEDRDQLRVMVLLARHILHEPLTQRCLHRPIGSPKGRSSRMLYACFKNLQVHKNCQLGFWTTDLNATLKFSVPPNLVGFLHNTSCWDGLMGTCLPEKLEQRGMCGGRGKYLRKI